MEQEDQTVYWTSFEHKDWHMHIAATSRGLCYVGSRNHPFEELDLWVQTRIPEGALVRDDEAMRPYTSQLSEYFDGKRTLFTFPTHFIGTAFQMSVWNALHEIPYGQTASYTQVANHIQRPGSARAVGAAIGANPLLVAVPCHRVVGASGALTGYRGGLDMKEGLLLLEQGSMPDKEIHDV
jgi:methylated-DNA-[protein]-cysteine S-methyltransferase